MVSVARSDYGGDMGLFNNYFVVEVIGPIYNYYQLLYLYSDFRLSAQRFTVNPCAARFQATPL